MIVRPRPHWLHLLFVRRGSLVRHILSQQLCTLLLACAVVWSHGRLFHWKVTLTATPSIWHNSPKGRHGFVRAGNLEDA